MARGNCIGQDFSELFTNRHLKRVPVSLFRGASWGAFHRFTGFTTTTRFHFFIKSGKTYCLVMCVVNVENIFERGLSLVSSTTKSGEIQSFPQWFIAAATS